MINSSCKRPTCWQNV